MFDILTHGLRRCRIEAVTVIYLSCPREIGRHYAGVSAIRQVPFIYAGANVLTYIREPYDVTY